jgi:hypothetical protein
MFEAKAVEKIPTHFMLNKIMWKKYGTAGQATDDSMAQARYVLDT